MVKKVQITKIDEMKLRLSKSDDDDEVERNRNLLAFKGISVATETKKMSKKGNVLTYI